MRKVAMVAGVAVMALIVGASSGDGNDSALVNGDESDLHRIGSELAEQSEGVAGSRGPRGAAGAPGLPGDGGFAFDEDSPSSLAGGPASFPPPAPFADQRFVAPEETLAQQGPERKIISRSNITVEVSDVDGTVDRIRVIAEAAGGFLHALVSSGEGADSNATLSVRVPTALFHQTLSQIEAAGKVRSRNISSEDVTAQAIDLEARLKSAQREEESFLGLLERADSVSEILTVGQELTRVRTEIELLQGRISSLDRRIDLATIGVRRLRRL